MSTVSSMVSCIGSGRVGSKFFPLVAGWVELGWVSPLMGRVGSGHTKWTRGQLWGMGQTDRRTAGQIAL